MRNSIVRIKLSDDFKIPVDVEIGSVYTVEIDNIHHVKLVGIEQWISKECIEEVDPSTEDYQTVFEERIVTFKTYSTRRLKNGIPIENQHAKIVGCIVSDTSSPQYKKSIPDFDTRSFFDIKSLKKIY